MLSEALELAKKNEVKGLPKMAAIISKRKRIISTGVNQRKTHPLMQRFTDNHLKVHLHAEIDAIKNALKTHRESELKGAEIFVARVMKSGQRGIAKPCAVCQRALDEFGITGVYWTEYE
jgi:tRNA(Arg) A34 adenosine deaminase TadA